MKKVLIMFLGVVAMIGAFKVLSLVDNDNYRRAEKECGKNNVVATYDNIGDRYYTCEVAK